MWTVELYQRRIADRLEAVDLAGLDDKDVSSAALEGLAVDCPRSTALAGELVRVPHNADRQRDARRVTGQPKDISGEKSSSWKSLLATSDKSPISATWLPVLDFTGFRVYQECQSLIQMCPSLERFA
jgi:hypothetical protein